MNKPWALKSSHVIRFPFVAVSNRGYMDVASARMLAGDVRRYVGQWYGRQGDKKDWRHGWKVAKRNGWRVVKATIKVAGPK